MSLSEGYNFADLEDGIIIENRDNNSFNSTENLYSSISSDTTQQRNSTPLITIDSDDEDEQRLNNEINWEELPSCAVENIYAFLSRTDQSRMSQVCSRWSDNFNSPRLWKTMKFYLPEDGYSSDIYPEVRFARKYASMFKHVEIVCKSVKIRLIGVICRQLKLFLQAMASSSQLVSIKFINMRNYFRRLDDTHHEDLFQAIISFFSTQENLKTVVFQDSGFSKEKGMELLKAIFHSNTMTNLTLRGFVNEAAITVFSQQYMLNLSEVCGRIANVQSLEVDYTQIFEDIIHCLYSKISSGDYQLDKKKFGMSTLNIFCEGKRHLGFRGILPGTWKHVRNVFRDLKVKIDVTIHSHLANEMEKFLVKEIPLQSLDFRYEKFSAPSRIDISALFTHLRICKYEGHLEALNVLWLPSKADFAGSIIPFVQSCENLQNLHIRVAYTPSGIENILRALLENHPISLKSITLWFNYLNADQPQDNLRALSEEYYPLFKAQGIECFLFVDPSRSLRNRARNIAP
ncbi:hypothetical protein AVEN_64096-1 [Araneus ventricosus]|uniref:F-box domain-containing protein n=1 Tax=Araneus ventricosus TaxID=182803 RepID=A0A4Y2C6Z1_ARAVE|nr:hypothetical protein AVEN_64096-1 [Araneus ventricosus]